MSHFSRRQFLWQAASTAGALAGLKAVGAPSSQPAGTATRPARFRIDDTVTLGRTGIRTSRLAMGTGTKSGREQRELGVQGLIKLLRHAHDEGVRWWDTADMYKMHDYLRQTLKEIPRDKVVITSKTKAKTAEEMWADLERFRKELGTEYIDIILLHCMTDGKWPEKMRGAMDALSEAKQKGLVRAVGCSCHTFEALEAAANEPWVEVDLARINPFAVIMDVSKREEVPKVVRTLQRMHEQGKAVYGTKILGEGRLKGDQIDESLRFVLSQRFVSGFTIGFGSQAQVDDIARRMDRVRV